MATLTNRIEKLEARALPAAGRVYAVTGGTKSDDGAAWLRAEGYTVTDNDLVIRLVGFEPAGQFYDPGPFAFCGPAPSLQGDSA
jgi:hypothetical protein